MAAMSQAGPTAARGTIVSGSWARARFRSAPELALRPRGPELRRPAPAGPVPVPADPTRPHPIEQPGHVGFDRFLFVRGRLGGRFGSTRTAQRFGRRLRLGDRLGRARRFGLGLRLIRRLLLLLGQRAQAVEDFIFVEFGAPIVGCRIQRAFGGGRGFRIVTGRETVVGRVPVAVFDRLGWSLVGRSTPRARP